MVPGMTSVGWPAISYEERPWEPSGHEMLSVSARRAHRGPYRAAVVPLLREARLELPSAVAAEVAEASAEIARFDAEIGAELAPFSSILLRSESASSSQIENLMSGARAIALAELGDRAKRNATEIVGNVAAMNAAIDLADRLDADAVLAMHRALLEETHPDMAGRWREEQVWIGGSSYGPHLATYVAPHQEHVPALMQDLIRYAGRDDVAPLALAAVAHAQFETIHPFPDGNGRTGRALIHAILRARDLTRQVTVPVSAGLLTDTERYFATLTAYREGDPLPIIRELAQASDRALTNGRQLVGDLRSARERWEDAITARKGSKAWPLMDLVMRQPVLDTATIAAQLPIGVNNVMRAVTPLLEVGALNEFTGFRRNRMWQSTEVLSALDAFAARAGRRR
jgi:Fic family protein